MHLVTMRCTKAAKQIAKQLGAPRQPAMAAWTRREAKSRALQALLRRDSLL